MKNLLPLLICLSFIACDKMEKAELNLDDLEIPVNIAEELTGDEDCDANSVAPSCGDGFVLLDLCIECTACLTDSRLEGYRNVDIFIEALPKRDGQKISTVISGPNYDFQETICVPFIEGQASQVIGFSLNPGSGPFSIIQQYVVFDNVTLNKNGVAKYHKDIVPEDLWDIADCDEEVKIAWEKDPTEIEESFTIDYTYCVVGSIGDCTSVSIPRTDFDLEVELEEMKDSYNGFGLPFGGVPCSGIYVSFD